jgi:hypothetical protein
MKKLFGWACFQVWTRIPSNNFQITSRVGLWLLSWAGYYAHAEKGQ